MKNGLRNNRCKKLLKGKNGILSVGGNSDIVVSMAMVNYHSSSLVFNEGPKDFILAKRNLWLTESKALAKSR